MVKLDEFDASLINAIVNRANENRWPLLAFVDLTTDTDDPRGVIVYRKDCPDAEYIVERVHLANDRLATSDTQYCPTQRAAMKLFHETPYAETS